MTQRAVLGVVRDHMRDDEVIMIFIIIIISAKRRPYLDIGLPQGSPNRPPSATIAFPPYLRSYSVRVRHATPIITHFIAILDVCGKTVTIGTTGEF